MPRTALHSSDVAIEQKNDIPHDPADRESDVVVAQPVLPNKEYAQQLAFAEEPVTIRIERSSDRNAPGVFAIWCNGAPPEMMINGKWLPLIQGYLPVGQSITVKRKVVAIIASAKVDSIETVFDEAAAQPDNTERRVTSALNTFSVIRDDNPKGHAWLTELLRRNF